MEADVATGWQAPTSLLIVPGDQPALHLKAARSAPDAVIIDLEDGVAPQHKAKARSLMADAVEAVRAGGNGRIEPLVRLNAIESPWFEDDLAMLPTSVSGVVLPKVESASLVHAALVGLARRRPRVSVVAGIESARGLEQMPEIVNSELVLGAYFGAEDYIADVGGRRTKAGTEVLYARSRIVAACRGAGVIPFDQVVVDVRDDAAFIQECEAGITLGFAGKLCIHPRQVELLHDVYDPTPEEIERAARIARAYEAASESGAGICVVDGRMIDAPLAAQARHVGQRAERASTRQHKR